MAQLSRLFSGVDRYRFRSPARRPFASRSEIWRRGATSRTSDLDLARLTRTNLLVIGEDDDVARLMTSLWPSPTSPIVVRRRGELLQFSPLPARTLVIYDVDTLTSREQQALYLWMARNRRTQVVSTSARSLQPMLQTGAFDEELYYRLNVMMLDLTSPAA